MSKYVKDMITRELAQRLAGVEDAALVNVVGLDATASVGLRKELRTKNISLLVVKNSLARRATEGTPLAAAFQGGEGTLALMWGASDFVSLAKEVMRLHDAKEYPAFQARGGVMDGERLTAERLKEISTWPSREEQLSILAGQILAPGANLLAAIQGPGGKLASQIKQKSEGDSTEPQSADASPAAEASPEAAGLPEPSSA
jgi:ribosomal protein L10